jgi:S1-C subfamily serine protease
VSGWIKNFIIVASLLLVSCTGPVLPESNSNLSPDFIQTQRTVEVRDSLGAVLEVIDAINFTLTEKRTRQAAVKVRSLLYGGHGSGTYMVAYGRRVVATAAHVVRNESTMLIEGRDGEVVIGKVVFVDHKVDLAFLVVPEIETRTAIRYRPESKYDERLVGKSLTYTGFPSHHDLLTIHGYIAALERNMIVSNMFGWFGSSGSGVFDDQGRYVGCVSGLDVGRFGQGVRIPLEDIVWVAPISQIDQELLKARITTSDVPEKEMKSIPGAAAPRRGGLRD